MTKKKSKNRIKGQDKIKEKLNIAVDENIPALLIGETGVGKTSVVRDVAPKKREVVRFNLTGETTVDDFVGRKGLKNGETEWEDGVLLNCLREGHWMIIDEINAALPEILFVLHSLIDDDRQVLVTQNDNEIVEPHENFRLFATMNPVDEYAGTKGLNKSLKSRFGMVLKMSYPEAEKEMEIIEERAGVETMETLSTMVDTANKVRELKKDEEVFFSFSTRDLIQWGQLKEPLGLKEAFKAAVLNKAVSDAERILEAFNRISDKVDMLFEDKNIDGDSALDYIEKKLDEIEDERENMREEIIEEEMEQIEGKVKKQIIENLK